MQLDRRARLYERFDRQTELPLLVLAVAMLPLIIIPLAVDLAASVEAAFWTADWLIWAAFAVELIVKTYLSPRRLHYLRTHWFDVLIVLIPFLRPLRIVRSARALRLLRLVRVAALLSRVGLTGRSILRARGLGYVLLFGVLAVFAISGLVVLVERSSAGASVDNFPTALWWAATTITTVGYGDTAPVTAAGRGFGVVLMIIGIGVFGLFTANVAAFFIEEEEREHDTTPEHTALLLEMQELRADMARLARALEAVRAET